MAEYWRSFQLPRVASALSRQYPGVKIEAEVAQYMENEPFQRIVFTAPMATLDRFALLPAKGRQESIDEYGTKIVLSKCAAGIRAIHFHDIHHGEAHGLRSRTQHPENAKTRAIVEKVLGRVASRYSAAQYSRRE